MENFNVPRVTDEQIPTKRQLTRIRKLADVEYKRRFNDLWKLLLKKAQKWCVYRHADSFGRVQCFTCTNRGMANDKGMHAGHFISRAIKQTAYLQINLRVQCYQCNDIRGGNSKVYADRLGEAYVEHLNRIKKGPLPFHTANSPDVEKLATYLVL